MDRIRTVKPECVVHYCDPDAGLPIVPACADESGEGILTDAPASITCSECLWLAATPPADTTQYESVSYRRKELRAHLRDDHHIDVKWWRFLVEDLEYEHDIAHILDKLSPVDRAGYLKLLDEWS